MKEFDAIIIGAGVAGCMAAKVIAKAGYEVCLVEYKSKEDIGRKICGEVVGAHHFKRLSLEEPTGLEVAQKIVGLKVYSPNMRAYFKVESKNMHGYILNRHAFGQRLLKLAMDAGASLLDLTQVIAPIVKDGFVSGVLVRNRKKDEKLVLMGKVVVDASGFSAVIRRKLPLEMGVETGVNPGDVMICYREIRRLKNRLDYLSFGEIYLDQEVTPGGYVWIFPKGSDVVNVGLGITMGQSPLNPRGRFYEHVLPRPLFKGSELLEGGTWYVPTRRPLSSMVGDGVLIVGDAACQVNPIHGGGIGPSMGGGSLAGEAIVRALKVGDISRKGLWAYNVEYMRKYGANHAGLDVLRMFLQSCTNEDLNYGMYHRLLTEDDLLKAGEGIRLRVTELAVRALRGIGRLSLLRRLINVISLMKRVRTWYMGYPESPDGLLRWRDRAEALFKLARARLG